MTRTELWRKIFDYELHDAWKRKQPGIDVLDNIVNYTNVAAGYAGGEVKCISIVNRGIVANIRFVTVGSAHTEFGPDFTVIFNIPV
jgi:hypothetical protein